MPTFTQPITCHRCGHQIGLAPAVANTFPASDPYPLPGRCPKCGEKQRLPKARFVQRLIVTMLFAVPAFMAALLAWFLLETR